MKTIAHAARLPAFLVLATCVTLSACGQGGKGKKDNPPAPQPANPFASKTMAMKQEAYTFNMGMEDAVFAFQNDQVPDYALTNINAYTYDDLGRFAREIIVVLPQSPVSNLPDEGAIAYDMQFTYSASEPWEEELAVQEIWDAWGDGATLARQRTTTWSGNLESFTFYNTANPGQISGTATFEITEELNTQGYLMRATRENLDMPGPVSEEILYRAANGIQLERIEAPGETVDYTYYPNGALESMVVRPRNATSREETTYHYAVQNDVYVIVLETRSYNPDGFEVGVRTAIELFQAGTCHEATRRREIFQRPNWSVCRELSNWQ